MSLPRRLSSKSINLSFIVLVTLTSCQPALPAMTATPSALPKPRPTPTATPERLPPVPEGALDGLEIQVWHPWFGVEASLFESQIEEFNNTNEWGVSVRSTSQSSYAELYSSVNEVIPGPERPQLVVALPEYAVEWDTWDYVTDLTDYISDPTYGLGIHEVDDFPTVFWSQDVVAGRRLGVPAERGASVLIYNATWARSMGYEVAPQTSGEFREQACAAHQLMSADQDTKNDGQGGWIIHTGPMTILSWMTAFDGGVLEGNSYRFLTPKNLAALTFLKQLHDDGCSWLVPTDEEARNAFSNRRALFATAGLEEFSDFSRSFSAVDNADTWTVLGFPGPDRSGLIVYGSSYVVLKSTPEQQLASWLFVRWLLANENQKKWVETTGLFPLRISLLGKLEDYRKSHPQWSAAIDLLPLAQIQPQLASWRQVRVMLGDGFDAMFRSNTPAGRVAEILAIMDRTSRDITE